MNLNDGADSFVGYVGADFVSGGTGNDTLNGGAGNDELAGDEGDDSLVGGTGNDIFSISGNDWGQDTFAGGEGNDQIKLESDMAVSRVDFSAAKVTGLETLNLAFNNLHGTIGNDVFNLSAIAQITNWDQGMNLNDGADSFVGHVGADFVSGGTGNDTLNGGAGNDELSGDEGNNSLIGGTGNDVFLIGGPNSGQDKFDGGEGSDQIKLVDDITASQFDFSAAKVTGIETLNLAFNNLHGTTGNDVFNLSGIAQIINWDDLIDLNDGADSYLGSAGVDWVDGGAGNDTMQSGGGNDLLSGAGGADLIVGGTGSDTMYGGDGNDRFSPVPATPATT